MTISQEGLKELLNYDPLSGVFSWRCSVTNSVRTGQQAGSLHSSGYRNLQLNLKTYREHKLVWLYVYGTYPTDNLDHINGIRNDNRITNLRLATRSQNSCNRGKGSNNSTGFKGVTPVNDKYRARVASCKKYFNLGTFPSAELAHQAYCKKASELHGEFFNAG